MKRKLLSLILTATLLGSVLAGCAGSNTGSDATNKTQANEEATNEEATNEEASYDVELKTLHIAYVGSGVNWPNDLLGIAMDKGYLDEELAAVGWKAESTSFQGGNLVNEALTSGDADFGIYGDVPATNGKGKGVNTTLIMLEVHNNDAALVTGTSSDIKTIKELKGKTVATLEGSFMHKVLVNMLEDNGMTIDDIQFTNMQSVDAATAVQTGAVDAALLSEVQYCVAATQGEINVILSGSDNNEWRGSSAIVANSDFLANNRDAAVAFLRAYVRADEFARGNYDDAITSLSKAGLEEESLKFRFPTAVEFNLDAGDEAKEALQSVVDFLRNTGISKQDVDINSWIDSSVLEDARK